MKKRGDAEPDSALQLLPSNVYGSSRATGRNRSRSFALRCARVFLTTTLAARIHPQLHAQQVPSSAPLPDNPTPQVSYPIAQPVVEPEVEEKKLTIDADKMTRNGEVYTLSGNVEIHYNGYTVLGENLVFNQATGEVVSTGHIRINGGPADEYIAASHGEANLKQQTGRFYDVTGSIGVRTTAKGTTYTTSNPFLFTGRQIIQHGPRNYEILNGTVTSCQLPNPDWNLASKRFVVVNGQARGYNSTFHLLNMPVLFLPYVTHPTSPEERTTGFLIPTISKAGKRKGYIVGEQVYVRLSRSADLTVGSEYFSVRGFSQLVTFRYKGDGLNFLTAHYTGLLDRGYVDDTGKYVNQGGQDFLLSGRKDLSSYTRLVAHAEYLSSYVYREAFNDSFNQAVSTDVVSHAFATYQKNGLSTALFADRYQGLKSVVTGQQVRIIRAPSLDLDLIERRLGSSPIVWSFSGAATGLKRAQQNFTTGGVIERFDLHPQISVPLHAAGWVVRPQLGLRNTFYSRSRVSAPIPGFPPVQVNKSLNRTALEMGLEFRPPVLERTFAAKDFIFGREMKHTIEPFFNYRYVTGVDDYNRTLRFDATDVVTNTNEFEYGITQRLFFRKKEAPVCDEELAGNTRLTSGCGGMGESVRWRLAQKHYFDPSFNGSVANGRRNIFESTLDFSGIAFITQPREISPMISELRVRISDKTDVEWDVNYDFGQHRFTASNVFIDEHIGQYFGGLSFARLNAPGRFLTSPISDFTQLRVLLGYGAPNKKGFSAAVNSGIDLNAGQTQYGALQVSYFWDCCGFSAEYRKFELGAVRNDNIYRFNFTLANIGSAGNLRRAERLF